MLGNDATHGDELELSAGVDRMQLDLHRRRSLGRDGPTSHACVAPAIVNNNPETMEPPQRPLPTAAGCVADIGPATLACGAIKDSRAAFRSSRPAQFW
jgi:hypothetical protein